MFWTKFNLDKYREFLFKEMTNLQKIPKIMLRFERFGATILVIRKTLSDKPETFSVTLLIHIFQIRGRRYES
mgnify:FL=1